MKIFSGIVVGILLGLFAPMDWIRVGAVHFGTATNVVGDAALTMIVDKAVHGEKTKAS